MALRRATAALCALALLALAGCESEADRSRAGAEREGLAFPVGGVNYNVFITRELNPRIVPDKAYFTGGTPTEPGKDHLIYGVFLQACNKTDKPQMSANDFFIADSQGHHFKPTPLPKDNAFAYHQTLLKPDECIPEVGSVAQLGPTAGSLLLFKFPLQDTENRPLDLHIESPFDPAKGKSITGRVELDL